MRLAILALAAALALPAAALADPPPPGSEASPAAGAQAANAGDAREAVRQACAADMKSLCPDMQGKEARKCMRANADKLSSGCKDAVAKAPPRGKRGG